MVLDPLLSSLGSMDVRGSTEKCVCMCVYVLSSCTFGIREYNAIWLHVQSSERAAVVVCT